MPVTYIASLTAALVGVDTGTSREVQSALRTAHGQCQLAPAWAALNGSLFSEPKLA